MVGDESFRLVHIHRLKVLSKSRVLPERVKPGELERRGISSTNEKKIWLCRAPKCDFREVSHQGRHNHAKIVRCERIGLHPLDKNPTWREPPPDGGIELIREEGGDSRDPRVRRLRNNQIVLVRRSEQKVSRVIKDYPHSRVAQNATVEALKIGRRAYNSGLDFDAVNFLDVWITGNS